MSALYGLDQILELVYIAANERGSKMRTDCVNDAARRIARDNARWWCFAIARCPRICADEYDDVLYAVHASARRLERNTQGDGEHSKLDLCDFHGNPPFVYRILSYMRVIWERSPLCSFIALLYNHYRDSSRSYIILTKECIS